MAVDLDASFPRYTEHDPAAPIWRMRAVTKASKAVLGRFGSANSGFSPSCRSMIEPWPISTSGLSTGELTTWVPTVGFSSAGERLLKREAEEPDE